MVDANDIGIAPNPNASQRLHRVAVVLVACTMIGFFWRSEDPLGLKTLLGEVILFLASRPAIQWAKHNRAWFPAFELLCLTTIAFYAIPLLVGHKDLSLYQPRVVTESAMLVIAFLAAANLSFNFRSRSMRPSPWAMAPLLSTEGSRYVPAGMFLNTIYIYVETFTDLLPSEIIGTLRALFFGLGTVAIFVLARQIGQGVISGRTRAFFIVNLAAQVIILFSQLYLIRGISLLALGAIAYSAAKRRVPILWIALILPVVAVLHNGKSEMRKHYWEEMNPLPTLSELPAFFNEWIDFGLQVNRDAESSTQTSVVDRASLIQMLCMSVEGVPSQKPFLYGESYFDIPALAIPRFLWPEKPSSLMANIRLAVYFDLIDPDDPFQYSIAFGMIAEAYLNFGLFGVTALGLFFGVLYKHLSILGTGAPQFSALGILMILLTALSFQAELVMATWLSSLFQACVVCIGLPLAYHKLTHG